MNQVTRRVARTSAVIHAAVHASVMLLPAVLGDVQREFGVGLLGLALAANGLYLAFGVAALPAGALADRLGPRRMMAIASLGSTVGLLGVAVAPTFTWFAACLLGLGLASGIYHPSSLSLLSRAAHAGETGRALGIHGAGGNLGEALAPTLAALLAARLGWRHAFLAAAAVSLLCGALVLSLPRRFGGPACPAHARRPTLRALLAGLRALLASRPLRLLLLVSLTGGLIYRGALTFLPLHLSSDAGGPREAAFLTSLVLLCGLAAQRVGGELADRLPRPRLLLIASALFAPVLLALALGSGSGSLALALAFGWLWYMTQPLLVAMAAEHAPLTDHGLLFGLQFASTFAFGSLGVTLGGALTERGGTPLAYLGFALLGIVQLAAAAAVLRASRPLPAPDASLR